MERHRIRPSRATRAARRAALALLAASGLLGPVGVAEAAVRFCNRTGEALTVAIAFVEKDAPGTSTGGHRGVTTRGWWNLSPGECNQVSDINAEDHWVYYSVHSRRSEWRGGSALCVHPHRFQVVQGFRRPGDDCPGDGRLADFRRMDATAANFTINLR